MYFVLIYELVEDYLQRRPEFRAEHLSLAREAEARGELVMAGALAEPADQALLVFRSAGPDTAAAFAAADPYVKNRLVRSWRVRPWTVVLGGDHPA